MYICKNQGYNACCTLSVVVVMSLSDVEWLITSLFSVLIPARTANLPGQEGPPLCWAPLRGYYTSFKNGNHYIPPKVTLEYGGLLA